MENKIIRALTIAGSDASGGAGMAADLTTFEEFGIFGQVALTTVVSMDPATWGHKVQDLPLQLVQSQLDTVFASDVPLHAMKTGMLGTPEIVRLVRQTIDSHTIGKVVIDPVLVCKGTDEVLNPSTADAIRAELLPVADVVTPNVFEAGALSEMGKLETLEEIKEAARKICALGAKTVVIKAGRTLPGDKAIDVFYDGREFTLLEMDKVTLAHTHGAGCTFAAAVTAGLALGKTEKEAVAAAKDFVYAALVHGFAYNKFVSPVFRPAQRCCR